MAKEIRYVTADWQHPQKEEQFIPLSKLDMPQWKDGQATHRQLYDSTNNGIPLSPVMKEPEALAQWLVDNKIPALGDQTTSYEAWLMVCQGKSVIHDQKPKQPDPFDQVDQRAAQRQQGLSRG